MGKHYHINKGVKRYSKLRISAVMSCLFVAGVVAVTNLPNSSSSDVTTGDEQLTYTSSETAKQPEKGFRTLENMPWPTYGSAAYVVPKDKLLAKSDKDSEAIPIASLAKVITALAIVKKRPLQTGEQGPSIPITPADEEIYREYVRKSGTVVPVQSGTTLTEYQALQAILLPSANNIADTAAIWAFGSLEEYTTFANEMVSEMGLENTVVAVDASGYSPLTISTADDISQLGYYLVKHPVLREIITQSEATIPFAGTIRSLNTFANEDDVIGIKVGYTEEAGNCYIAAKIRTIDESTEEISVVSVLGASDFQVAAQDSIKLLAAGNAEHDRLGLFP